MNPALLIPIALASTPPTASLALSQEAIDAVTPLASGLSFDFARPEVSFEVGCWSSVGVRDLSLSVPIDRVAVTLHEHYLTARVELGTVRGEDWQLFTRGAPGDESCLSIDADMAWLELRDGVFEVDLKLALDGEGRLVLVLYDTPRVQGTVDMDVEWAPEWSEALGLDWDWWPDDFFVDIINDYLLELVPELVADALPGLLRELAPEPTLRTEVGDFTLDGRLVELRHDEASIRADAALDVHWTGQSDCAAGGGTLEPGRTPSLALDSGQLALGTSEAFVNELLLDAWRDGLLCLDARGVDALALALLPDLAETLDDFDLRLEVAEPPRISFERSAVTARVRGLRLGLDARYKRELVELLDLELDLSAAVGARLDPRLAAVVLDPQRLDLDIDVREASHLLSDQPGAEQSMEDFLERFAPPLLEGLLQDLAVAGAVYHLDALELDLLDGLSLPPLTIKLAALALGDGGVEAGVDLYGADDPAVDRQPPQTGAAITAGRAASVLAAFHGSDDRDGALAWRWRLDGGDWSAWSLEPGAEIPVAEPGYHTLEVAARDRWWNIDPTPWRQGFDRDALPREDPLAPLGCGAAPAGPGALLGALGLFALAGRRRRR